MFWKDAEIFFPCIPPAAMWGSKSSHLNHSFYQSCTDLKWHPWGFKGKEIKSVRKLPNFLPLAPQRQHNMPKNPADKTICTSPSTAMWPQYRSLWKPLCKGNGEESRFFFGISKTEQHWGKARGAKQCISKAGQRSENKISKHKGAPRRAWGSFCSPI